MTKVCGQVNIPTTNNEAIACKNYYDTDCVIYKKPISYFGTTDPSTSTQVFDFIISSLQDARGRIVELEGAEIPEVDVLGTLLTGFNPLLTGDVVATDTVLQAFGKLQYQLDNVVAGGNFVTLDTTQTITADKTFSGTLYSFTTSFGEVRFGGTAAMTGNAGVFKFKPHLSTYNTYNTGQSQMFADNLANFTWYPQSTIHGGNSGYSFKTANTTKRDYTFPNKSGTVAMLDDVTGINVIDGFASGSTTDASSAYNATKLYFLNIGLVNRTFGFLYYVNNVANDLSDLAARFLADYGAGSAQNVAWILVRTLNSTYYFVHKDIFFNSAYPRELTRDMGNVFFTASRFTETNPNSNIYFKTLKNDITRFTQSSIDYTAFKIDGIPSGTAVANEVYRFQIYELDSPKETLDTSAVTTYTVVPTDDKAHKVISGANAAISVDTTSLTDVGDVVEIDFTGTGTMTIGGTGTLLVNSSKALTASQYSTIVIRKIATDTYRVYGELNSI